MSPFWRLEFGWGLLEVWKIFIPLYIGKEEFCETDYWLAV
jgi:hypothetical protein